MPRRCREPSTALRTYSGDPFTDMPCAALHHTTLCHVLLDLQQKPHALPDRLRCLQAPCYPHDTHACWFMAYVTSSLVCWRCPYQSRTVLACRQQRHGVLEMICSHTFSPPKMAPNLVATM